MISINNETNGKYHLSFYGAQFALGLRGNKEFITKAYNLLHNNSVSNGKLHWFYDQFAYVVIESKKRLLDGLIRQFRGEIILNKEIEYKKEVFDEETQAFWVEYDDEKIDKLAQDKAEKFMQEKIIIDNFMVNLGKFTPSIYQIGKLNDLSERAE